MSGGQIRLNVGRDPSPADVVREVDRLLVSVAFEDNLLLRSPNGALWRITVSNGGTLSAVAVS
jgi:hypothetical protein